MKLKRYHIEIYCPAWAMENMLTFTKGLKFIKLTYSLHSTKKLISLKKKYQRAATKLIQNLDMSNELYLDYVFEFYANNNNVIKKACYRFPMRDLDIDIILVISSTGKIVTIYTTHRDNKYRLINVENYEQGDIIHEGKIIVNH